MIILTHLPDASERMRALAGLRHADREVDARRQVVERYPEAQEAPFDLSDWLESTAHKWGWFFLLAFFGWAFFHLATGVSLTVAAAYVAGIALGSWALTVLLARVLSRGDR